MSKFSERREGEVPPKPNRSTGETGFVPRPVAPEEGRRPDAADNGAPRDIVELTSPIGHRLRLPPGEVSASDSRDKPGKR